MSSVIKSIQKVSITITSGSSTGSATISAVTVANAVVWFQGNTSTNTGSARYNQAAARVALTSATTVTATCGSSSPTIVLDAVVVEFASGVNSIQSGTIVIPDASASNTTTLGTPVGPNAFVLYNGFTSSAALVGWPSISPSLVLTGTTTVTATTGGSSGITTVAYTVVDLDDTIIASVAAYSFTDASASLSYTKTITSVTAANTLLIYNGATVVGGGDGSGCNGSRHTLQLTDGTTVTLTRGGSDAVSRTVYWTVVEFQAGIISATGIQRGTVSVSTATSGTATLGTAVDLSLAFCNWCGEHGVTSTIQDAFGTQQLTDASTVTATFESSTTYTTSWEVIEFASGGGTTFNVSMSASASPSALAAISAGLALAASASSVPAFVRSLSMARMAAASPDAESSRAIGFSVFASGSPSASIVASRSILLSIAGAASSAASVVRGTAKAIVASVDSSVTTSRASSLALSLSTSPAASAHKTGGLALAAASSSAATISSIKVRTQALLVSVGFALWVNRLASIIKVSNAGPLASIRRSATSELSVSTSPSVFSRLSFGSDNQAATSPMAYLSVAQSVPAIVMTAAVVASTPMVRSTTSAVVAAVSMAARLAAIFLPVGDRLPIVKAAAVVAHFATADRRVPLKSATPRIKSLAAIAREDDSQASDRTG